MRTLKPYKFNWIELNNALNEIVDVVNCNSPLEGDNIHLDEHGGQGVSINAVVGGSTGDQGGSGGGGGSAQPISSITISGVQWQQITLVDPGSCAVSQVTVLTQGDGQVTFSVTAVA